MLSSTLGPASAFGERSTSAQGRADREEYGSDALGSVGVGTCVDDASKVRAADHVERNIPQLYRLTVLSNFIESRFEHRSLVIAGEPFPIATNDTSRRLTKARSRRSSPVSTAASASLRVGRDASRPMEQTKSPARTGLSLQCGDSQCGAAQSYSLCGSSSVVRLQHLPTKGSRDYSLINHVRGSGSSSCRHTARSQKLPQEAYEAILRNSGPRSKSL